MLAASAAAEAMPPPARWASEPFPRPAGEWLAEWEGYQGDYQAVLRILRRLLLATPPGQLAAKFGVRFGHDLVDIAGFDGGLAALGFHQFVANIKQDGGTTLFRRAGEPSAALIEFQPDVREHSGELFSLFGVDASGFITLQRFIDGVLQLRDADQREEGAQEEAEPPASAYAAPQLAATPAAEPVAAEREAGAARSQSRAAQLSPVRSATGGGGPDDSLTSAWADAESYVERLAALEQQVEQHESQGALSPSQAWDVRGGARVAAGAGGIHAGSRRLQSAESANRRRAQGFARPGAQSDSDFESLVSTPAGRPAWLASEPGLHHGLHRCARSWGPGQDGDWRSHSQPSELVELVIQAAEVPKLGRPVSILADQSPLSDRPRRSPTTLPPTPLL